VSSIPRPLFAGAIAILSIALAVWALSKDPDEQPTPAFVAAQGDAPAPAPTPRPTARVSPAPQDSVLLRQAKEAQNPELDARQVLDANEAAWAREPQSPQKAAQVEDKFRVAMDSPDVTSVRFTPKAVSVQCRAGMCRLESEFPISGTSAEWALRVQLALGASVIERVVTIPQSLPGGGEKLVMYAYEPGRQPPG
jgi:hypothetical protein